MFAAYFDSEGLLLGYAEVNSDSQSGETSQSEWPNATYRRVFPYRPDNEPGLYYWDTVAGAFVNIANKPRPYAKASAALLNAALNARSRGETLPTDVIQALESFIVPTAEVPGAN